MKKTCLVINSTCLPPSLRQRRRPRWEGDSQPGAGGGMAGGPGHVGSGAKRTWWGLHDGDFKKFEGCYVKGSRFVPGGPAGHS